MYAVCSAEALWFEIKRDHQLSSAQGPQSPCYATEEDAISW